MGRRERSGRDGRLRGGLLVYSRKSLMDDCERHKQTDAHTQRDMQTETEREGEFNRLSSLCFALSLVRTRYSESHA